MNFEGSELVSNTNQLKMKSKDGKLRNTDVLDTEGIFRLIESVPSPNAEPLKLWFAGLGKERIDEVFNPEIVKNYYEKEINKNVITNENNLKIKYINSKN